MKSIAPEPEDFWVLSPLRRRRTAAPSSADTPMPMRILGDTGLDVSSILVGHERLAELESNIKFAYSQAVPTSLCPEEIA